MQKLSYQRSNTRARTYLNTGISLLVVLFSVYAAISLFGWIGAQESGHPPAVSADLGLTLGGDGVLVGESTAGPTHNPADNGFAYTIASPREMNQVVPRMNDGADLFSKKDTIEFVKHEVRAGENLWSIARRYNRQIHSIVSANQDLLNKYSSLPADVELRIPNHDGILTTLKNRQTMWDLMQSYQVDYRKILSFNEISSARRLQAGQELFIPGGSPLNPFLYRPSQVMSEGSFIWPVAPKKRRISSRYGDRMHPVLKREIFHRGVDFAGGRGSAVFSSRAGEVVYSNKWGEYGITVVIEHEGGYRTLYAHLLRTVVQKGQFVEQGQPIGFIGRSGMATGDNLHFEIRQNGKTYNPLNHLSR